MSMFHTPNTMLFRTPPCPQKISGFATDHRVRRLSHYNRINLAIVGIATSAAAAWIGDRYAIIS
ncbi:hypothetical protein J6590_099499 [Homalodisca vitripennis]|nr:hypothetical protein J6590_099499 [Homalodisca vitripennis]